MKDTAAATLYNSYTRGWKVMPRPGVKAKGEPERTKPYISNIPEFKQQRVNDGFAIIACDGVWDEMSSDTAVYLVGHFFEKHPSATGDEAAAFLLQRALMLVVNRLQIEEPELGVKTVDELMAMPPGKQGRRALHDDITVAVVRFVVAENEPSLSAKRPDRTDSMIVQGPKLRRGRRSDSFSTVTEEVSPLKQISHFKLANSCLLRLWQQYYKFNKFSTGKECL